jgi:hypothetical protein
MMLWDRAAATAGSSASTHETGPTGAREAAAHPEAATKLAAATDGPERQRWVGLAMAWQELARGQSPSTSGRTDEAA